MAGRFSHLFFYGERHGASFNEWSKTFGLCPPVFDKGQQ
jgi:hypothetical protein